MELMHVLEPRLFGRDLKVMGDAKLMLPHDLVLLGDHLARKVTHLVACLAVEEVGLVVRVRLGQVALAH